MKIPQPPVKAALYCVFILLLSIFCLPALNAQTTKFGNSYINLSKKNIGGAVQPGDTLEIRTSSWFTNFNSGTVYFVRYVDNVPSNTVFIDTSLRLITNEGLVFKQWTLAPDSDPGRYNASPSSGQYNVKINIGRTATAPTSTSNDAVGAGNLRIGGTKDRPLAGGNTLITTSFRVRVTGSVGDTIRLGAGKIIYKKSNTIGSADVNMNATQYKILISNNDPICTNAVGRNFVAEYGGTFDSGLVQTRAAPAQYPIPTYNPVSLSSSQSIGDGTYGIVNNLSPWASTHVHANKKPFCSAPTTGSPPVAASCTNRMFGGHWDIMGDHTGSTTSAGNAPAASGTRGGYMLVVNADYVTTEAYAQTITGLCPNTSYEFSLWVKNVCTNCGVDSAGSSTYKPGVYPNLSFAIDGLDRYSSGQIDTVGWQKKGFLFRTGATQSSISISIRNNASGGGGNDWAIDDIALVSCNPNLLMVPSGNSQVCLNSQLDINTTVTAFFKNYNHYRWEKSTDNGVTWSIPASGIGSPDPVTGVYVAPMIPASHLAESADHLNQYRFTVASTAANLLNPNCYFQDSSKIIVMVDNCNVILAANTILQGSLTGGQAQLMWTSEHESAHTRYEIEKSENAQLFYSIGRREAALSGTPKAVYHFTDPGLITGKIYYRVKIVTGQNTAYTNTILVNGQPRNGIRALANPFNHRIGFELESASAQTAVLRLSDIHGRTIRAVSVQVDKGITPVSIDGLGGLSNGTYTLHIAMGQTIINRLLVK